MSSTPDLISSVPFKEGIQEKSFIKVMWPFQVKREGLSLEMQFAADRSKNDKPLIQYCGRLVCGCEISPFLQYCNGSLAGTASTSPYRTRQRRWRRTYDRSTNTSSCSQRQCHSFFAAFVIKNSTRCCKRIIYEWACTLRPVSIQKTPEGIPSGIYCDLFSKIIHLALLFLQK